MKILKSEQARQRQEKWYAHFLSHVKGPTEHHDVPTSYGSNHVLLAGDRTKPPLVVLHGTLTSSAHAVPELGPLIERHYVIAPDIPGQSVHGLPIHLPMKDDSLSKWLIDILDGLGLDSVYLLGASWGGFLAHKTAAFAPSRVRQLVLISPAGVISGPLWKGLTKRTWPTIMYRMFPSERRLHDLVEPVFTNWDEGWARFTGDAVCDFIPDPRSPPLAADSQLRALKMPVLLFAGREDPAFPGAQLVTRMKALVPHVQVELLAGVKHCLPTTDEFRAWSADRVTRFFYSALPAPA